MLTFFKETVRNFSVLFYPNYCLGCDEPTPYPNHLCISCHDKLPRTNFIDIAGNPVEKTFYGRVNIKEAAAAFYFTKNSIIQHLIFHLKYGNRPEAGLLLGNLLGQELKKSFRFQSIDCILPLPLNIKREKKRGYNQAQLIAEGISKEWDRPVIPGVVKRHLVTKTQTGKDRVHRWQTMAGVFSVTDEKTLAGKHILLIDDVITTGATLEACATALLKVENCSVSIITAAWTI